MGSIGAPELLVVLVIALLVLGPAKLPTAAKNLGKAVGEFRKITSGFQAEVRDAFSEPTASTPRRTGTTTQPVTAAPAAAPTIAPTAGGGDERRTDPPDGDVSFI